MTSVLRRLEPRAQIRGEKTMKEVLARFAPNGEASGGIGPRGEAALNGLADADALVLDPLSYGNRGEVALARRVGDIGKIEVEEDLGPIHAARNHQIGVQHP